MDKYVLSIDDSPSIRNIVRSVLEKEGYKVNEAQDGVDALKKIQEQRYHSLLEAFSMCSCFILLQGTY